MSIIENTTAPNVVKDEYFREATPSETGYKSESVSMPVPFVSENQTFDLSARYESRQTADGRYVLDNFPTFVKKISGDTVKCTNLFYKNGNISIAWAFGDDLTVSYNDATQEFTINGSTTARGNIVLSSAIKITNASADKSYTVARIKTGGSITFSDSGQNLFYSVFKNNDYNTFMPNRLYESANNHSYTTLSLSTKGINATEFMMLLQVVNINLTEIIFNNFKFKLQIVEGSYTSSTMPAYRPYFKDLKNAYINNIVSAGRNLFTTENYTEQQGLTSLTYNGLNSFTAVATYDGVKPQVPIVWYDFELEAKAYTISLDLTSVGALTDKRPNELFIFKKSTMKLHGFTKMSATDTTNKKIVWTFALPEKTVWRFGFYLSVASSGTAVGKQTMTCENIFLVEGSYTALTMPPYQNYITDTYQLNSSVELGKYDYIDVVRKKLVRQTKTIAVTGDEFWGASTTNTQGKSRFALHLQESNLPKVLLGSSLICNDYPTVTNDDTWFNVVGISTQNNSNWIYIYDDAFTTGVDFKAHLKSLYDAGTPIIISYCAEDILSEEDIEVPETYFVWNKGSETIHQGEIDNSVYGALIEVDQTYVESYTMPLVVTQKSYTSYTIENGQITIHYPNESKTYFAQKVVGSNDD